MEPRRTPLFALHEEIGGKMVAFANWMMPVSYPLGVLGEHLHCRSKAALFDVSHMGQIELRGEDLAARLETLVPAGLLSLAAGGAKYSFFTNEQGGILDDLILSNGGDHWFLVVNASMRDQDLAHLRKHLKGIEFRELQDQALIALQGPMAADVLNNDAASSLTFMQTVKTSLFNIPVRISRLGYTGEDGFEISVPADQAEALARHLLADERVEAAGLGARDSLRLEAGLCLYGNDIDPTTSPLEASLNWAIPKRRREEGGFPGAERVQKELAAGPSRKLVGIRPEGRAPARQGTEIVNSEGERIGEVTSGGYGPTLQAPISMGYVQTAFSEVGTPLGLVIRGKVVSALVHPLPFVPQNYRR